MWIWQHTTRYVFFVSCLQNMSTTESWSTNKISRPNSYNHSSPLEKPFLRQVNQISSSLYTILQYLQAFKCPRHQFRASLDCLSRLSVSNHFPKFAKNKPPNSTNAWRTGACSPAGILPQKQSLHTMPDKAFCPTPLPFPKCNSKCWMQTHVGTILFI